MNKLQFLNTLADEKIEYCENEPMFRHTTFKIGGNADIFIKISQVEDLKAVISTANRYDVPLFILGRGSNLLVSDGGIQGAVVSLCGMDRIEVKDGLITCGAGATLRNVCLAAQENSLTGLEFAYGIPGSIGGALYMNAGAYGGEMKDTVVSATAIDMMGNEVTLSRDDMRLGYRTSVFKNSELIITAVSLKLAIGKREDIRAAMDDYFNRRREKQPLEYPSAGSTFKRPEGYFAGALIEKNGLKGASIGGACVSEKHAGFIINTGSASCKDVLTLIEKIKDTVRQNDAVELEPEVIFVGRG